MPRVLPSQVVQLIEHYFPVVKNSPNAFFTLDRSYRNECVSIAQAIDSIPAELLNPPETADWFELMSNIAILNFTIECWKTPYAPGAAPDNLGWREKPNPISIICDKLRKCPDQAVSAMTAGLEFLDDDDFKNALRLDLSSANSALSNGEWKAATVLAASVSEALLLWALKKEMPTRQSDINTAAVNHRVRDPNDLDKWVLDEYNKVAHDVGIIQQKTFKQVDLAREFRNYIHPGVEIRKNARCTIATAHSGIAAVEFIVEDLSARYGKP
jgi:hypothetical protein